MGHRAVSYARFGPDSDVYVFLSTRGLECQACQIDEPQPGEFPDTYIAHTTADMIAHLLHHIAAGQKVQQGCFDGLADDADDNDARMGTHTPGGNPKEYGPTVGQRIIDIRSVTDEERRLFAWGSPAYGEQTVAIVLDDGSVLIPMADAEGNGPGTLVRAADGALFTVTP